MGGVGVIFGMERSQTLDLAERHYKKCEDDEGWYRCEFCEEKVYIGENKTDLARHEKRCEWR